MKDLFQLLTCLFLFCNTTVLAQDTISDPLLEIKVDNKIWTLDSASYYNADSFRGLDWVSLTIADSSSRDSIFVNNKWIPTNDHIILGIPYLSCGIGYREYIITHQSEEALEFSSMYNTNYKVKVIFRRKLDS